MYKVYTVIKFNFSILECYSQTVQLSLDVAPVEAVIYAVFVHLVHGPNRP